MKFGCAICIFLNSENSYVEVRISRSVSEGPFNLKISRVDCTFFLQVFWQRLIKNTLGYKHAKLEQVSRGSLTYAPDQCHCLLKACCNIKCRNSNFDLDLKSAAIPKKVKVKVSLSLIAVGAVGVRVPLYLGHS